MDKSSALDRGISASYAVAHKLDPYSKHKEYINNYILAQGKGAPSLDEAAKTDYDILRERHRFLRTDADLIGATWEDRMAIKYYNRLFKEYCLADMSKYKENKIGLRWRTEREVFRGKGQFICGNLACEESHNLESYEVNFVYKEDGEKKQALVKLRVCPSCYNKLNAKTKAQKRKMKQRSEELKKGRSEESNADIEKIGNENDSRKEEEDKGARGSSDNKEEDASQIWKKVPELEANPEEDVDSYLAGMFP